jgi:hypothetical protein
MANLYKVQESQQLEKLLLEACDYDTRDLLRLSADMIIWPCASSSKPTLTVVCKSREITEAIGLRQAYIKTILKRLTGCAVVMSVYYQIPEGQVHFDTEGEVTPAKWYLCNRKECGKSKIPLPG